jgi:hypothetical protein
VGAGSVDASVPMVLPPVPEAVQRAAAEGKPRMSIVCCGHVDAGKSTLLGHLLYDLGCVVRMNSSGVCACPIPVHCGHRSLRRCAAASHREH